MIHTVWFSSGPWCILAFKLSLSTVSMQRAQTWGWSFSKLHSLQPHALLLCISRTNDNMHTIKLWETSPTAQRQSQHRGFCSLQTVLCTFQTSTKNPWAYFRVRTDSLHYSFFFATIFIPASSSQNRKKNQIK